MEEDLKIVSIHEIYDSIHHTNGYDFDKDKYRLDVRGDITFGFIEKDIQFFQKPLHPALKGVVGRVCGDLMTGKEFYACVDDGGIIDYDGILGDVYIDGYRSNLGLCHEGLCQGNFIVDGETWLEICDSHEVLVEWCNK